MKPIKTNWSPPNNLIIFESNFWILSHRFECDYPGYLIIAPKDHGLTDFLEIPDENMMELGNFMRNSYQLINNFFQPIRIYFCRFGNTANCSFHFHLIPIYDWVIKLFQEANPNKSPYGPELTEFISNNLIVKASQYKDFEPINQTISKLRNYFQRTG